MRITTAGLTVRYGAVAALSRIDLDIASGERRAVIGPNGAGKTTLFNAIAGELRPAEGSISLDGHDVTRLPAWLRARRGLARTFQRSALFPSLSVAENLALAVRARTRTQWRFWPASERGLRAEVEERLQLASLTAVSGRPAGAISHGEQRSLEIEIALAATGGLADGPPGRPSARAILLDEPMAGLSGGERAAAVDRLKRLPEEVTLLIVEHDLDTVFALAGRVTVLDHGIVIADGTAAEVREDPRVQEVYLGAG